MRHLCPWWFSQSVTGPRGPAGPLVPSGRPYGRSSRPGPPPPALPPPPSPGPASARVPGVPPPHVKRSSGRPRRRVCRRRGGAFGLVSIPISMYTATDSHAIRFHRLRRGTADRIRNRRVNERTGDEVPLEEIVKGYDSGGEYVIVEPGELDEIAPGRSKALEITGFAALDEIDPIFFDKTYYLGPKGKEHGKPYALLERALAGANRAGIATFVMRGREYLVALKSEEGLLTLHTLHWADEIRDPRKEIPDLPTGRTAGSAGELKMARQLVDALAHTGPRARAG
ncbi:Ku protein [Streptomyces sp. NPDC058746]|uniref:non-homologous end joining protein Ku n=1 Tax=Streptomyces sp. NPDC058746 TaxID=3346622 RepID=UPI0036C9E476